MNDILEPPAERDMPAGRSARMRADLLTTIHRPDRRHGAPRRLALVAAVVAVAAGAAATMARVNADNAHVVAMGQSEMSPLMQKAARWCLATPRSDPEFPAEPTSMTMADLAVGAQRGGQAVTMFIGPAGYRACDVDMTEGKEVTGGISNSAWTSTSKDWLPGPVQVLGMSSTAIDGGDVMVTGRVSDRVHRLLLDYGDGHTTAARLTRGTFGLISDGDTVKRNAGLVSYDADGTEIGRYPLFRYLDQPDDDQCYADPAGTVVYGKPGQNCPPAQPWRRAG